MIITAKFLRDNLGKPIRFKKYGDAQFRYGNIVEVSGKTREFNSGDDWHTFSHIKILQLI